MANWCQLLNSMTSMMTIELSSMTTLMTSYWIAWHHMMTIEWVQWQSWWPVTEVAWHQYCPLNEFNGQSWCPVMNNWSIIYWPLIEFNGHFDVSYWIAWTSRWPLNSGSMSNLDDQLLNSMTSKIDHWMSSMTILMTSYWRAWHHIRPLNEFNGNLDVMLFSNYIKIVIELIQWSLYDVMLTVMVIKIVIELIQWSSLMTSYWIA